MIQQQNGVEMVRIASVGTVGGRPRKESLVDTEVYTGAVVTPTSLKVFSNFSNFANTPVAAFTKQEGRDTNLAGNGGIGLPQGHLFQWYQWRHKLLTYGTNLGTLANMPVTEELHRLLQLMHCDFKFTQSVLITTPAQELPAGTGAAWGQLQLDATAAPAVALVMGPNCIPNRMGKVITIGKKPIQIQALQQFGITNFINQGGFAPTVDVYTQHVLDGVLVRATVA